MARRILRGVLLVVVGAALSGCATGIKFNPAGRGCAPGAGCKKIDSFDATLGNSILVGLSTQSRAGATGRHVFQMNLGTASLNGVPQYLNGTGGAFFTFAASFPQQVTSNSGGSSPTLIFGPGPPAGTSAGVFKIYRRGKVGSDLSGACFVESCGSTPILTGAVVNDSNFFGSFSVNAAAGTPALDAAFNGDDYPGQATVVGQGGFGATILVTFVDDKYFPGIEAGSSFLIATMQQSLPFGSTNPAKCFSSDAVTSCSQPGTASVGAVNGLHENMVFQTDASFRFLARPNATPTPRPETGSTMGLVLLGSLTAGQLRRRRSA